MAIFDGELYRDDEQSAPPVKPIVCVSQIIHSEQLATGQYHLLLNGITRAKIVEESCSNVYRSVRVAPIEVDDLTDVQLSQQRTQIDDLLCSDLLNELKSVSAIRNSVDKELPTRALVDLSILTLCNKTERYPLLAEPSLAKRINWLTGELIELRNVLKAAKPFEPPDLGNHSSLN